MNGHAMQTQLRTLRRHDSTPTATTSGEFHDVNSELFERRQKIKHPLVLRKIRQYDEQ
jgi:hypothetical protein